MFFFPCATLYLSSNYLSYSIKVTTFFNQFGCRFRHTQPDSKPCKPFFFGGGGMSSTLNKKPNPKATRVFCSQIFPWRSGPSDHFHHCPAAGTALSGRIQGGAVGQFFAPRWEVLGIHFLRDPLVLGSIKKNRPLTQGSVCFFLLTLVEVAKVFCL